ncbi:hypothetical protein Bb109J_c2480 [Bdellovibrio bacteriovorus]|uniref:Pycsar system effector family protein n=1 Tax=Bdellovibrio bacteriovorus TaxID=959 RepID=UPI00045BF199|nr:Pycsar system effector family protein [Bdellovibrio bacteriovorus]AHZ85170.1 hypothetical protein EP01_09500 [Bdellovibrio bacteriovorus]BEV69060.1 hypothetical protein Bb109J_c2480 [Bdellovibrio bacteriovorus]
MGDNTKINLEPKDEIRRDFLWKVIGRFDLYIGSTNTKAAFILTFCTVALGVVATNPEKLLLPFENHSWLFKLIAVAIFAVIGTLIGALWFILKVVNPFLKTSSEPGGYHSRVFFSDVANVPTADKYLASIKRMTVLEMEEDLTKQAYSLAEGASLKFKNLKLAIGFLLFGTIPIFVFYLLSRLIVTILGD